MGECLHLSVLLPLQAAQNLLARSANPNELNDKGESALHWACYQGKVQHLQLYLQFGGNPHLKDQGEHYSIAMFAFQSANH